MSKIYLLISLFFLNSCNQLLPPNLKPSIDQNKKIKVNIDQELVPRADILFVIDNSGSMYRHQTHLKNQIKHYANEILKITALDFHISVVGTDYVNFASSPVYLTRRTPDLLDTLKQKLLIGTSGSGIEKLFESAYTALNLAHRGTKPFLRKDAVLNLIFITDTDDQSQKWSPNLFYNFLLKIKQEAKKIISFSVLVNSLNCSGERTSGNIIKLKKFARISHGTVVDLCSRYAEELIVLAKTLVRQSLVFRLKEVPIYESIVVFYGNVIIPRNIKKGWSYNPETVSIRIASDFLKEMAKQGLSGKIKLSYKKARARDL